MSATKAEWIGMKIADGRYTVARRIGEGGMGTVYRAWDANLQTDVIIKVPKRSMLEDPEFRGRFQREIRSLVQLSHPNIVKIQDVGEFDGLPFCVMQFLSGGDLKSRSERTVDGLAQPMAADSLTTWLPAVADALDFIHKKNFVHRDVKPPNILFDEDGNTYLSDFGVAKVIAEKAATDVSLTGTGMVLGTPEYMAPEMVMGESFDGRADQYALAVTIYEVLAGFPPLTGPTPSAVLVKQTTEIPRSLCDVAPTIPRALSDAVMKALAKKPDERFSDCRAFASAVIAGVTGSTKTNDVGAVAAVANRVAGMLTQAATDTAKSLANTAGSLKAVGAARSSSRRLLLGLAAVIIVGGAGFGWWLKRPAAVGSMSAKQEMTADQEIKLTPEEEDQAIPNADHVAEYDFTNSLGMRMIFIRPGRFRISEDSEPTEIKHAFWIAQDEVTVAQYLYYCEKAEKKSDYPEWLRSGISSIESEKSKYAPIRDEIKRNASPVVGLTSTQMRNFCEWMSQQAGEPLKYSLPTPDQWVCAYRAGSNTKFYWGNEFDDTNANLKVSGDRFDRMALVGQFPPNKWGVRDMAGNVWEMTNSTKVFGGGWDSDSADDALPIGVSRAAPSPSIGFRIVGFAKPGVPQASQ